jgi:hypothetical protein
MMFERCVARSTELMARYAGGLLPACVSFNVREKPKPLDLIVSVTTLVNSRCGWVILKGCTMDEWHLHGSRDLGSRP